MENIKKNFKWIVLAIVLIVVYILFAVGVNDSQTRGSNEYLLIGNNLIWHEKDNKWYQETEVTDNLLDQKFTMAYVNDSKVSVDNLQYVDQKWYFFDKDYKEISNDDFRVAYSGNLDITLGNYTTEYYSSSDDKYIEEVANPESEEQFQVYRDSLRKVLYDFDDDGVYEILYMISSVSLSVEDYDFNSYMFLVKNNKIVQKIEGGIDPYRLEEILDIDNDGKFELVISKGILNNPTFDACYQIYEISDGKFHLVQDCLYVE